MSRRSTALPAEWLVLLGVACVYVAAFLAYYPPTHGVEDEAGFLNQALVWSRGALTQEGAGLADERLGGFIDVGGSRVGFRNPGRSLLSVPFVLLGGLRSVFLSGLLVHLLTTGAAAGVLRTLGRSPLWALLVLLHPTLALYSRTVMGDELAGLGLLLAFWALVGRQRPGLFTGLAIGCAAIARLHAGVVLPFAVLAVLSLAPPERRWREAGACALSGGAIGASLAIYGLLTYGAPVGQPILEPPFGVRYLGPNLIHYGTALLVLWPGMLLAPLGLKGRVRVAFAALCAPVLALLLVYYWFDRGPVWWQTAVLGQRLLQAVLPVWIVGFAIALEDVLAARWIQLRPALVRGMVAGACVAGAAGLVLLFDRHQRHLQSLDAARQEVERLVPTGAVVLGNSTIIKLFEVPYDDLERLRWAPLRPGPPHLEDGTPLEGFQEPWYVAHLSKGATTPSPELRALLAAHPMRPLPTRHPALSVYRAEAR